MRTGHIRKNAPFAAALLAFAATLSSQSPPAELKLKLTAPLSTKISRKGDMVVGRILQPESYAGGYLEGDVRDVQPGTAGKAAAIIFQFHSLHASGKTSRVGASLVGIANSKGQTDTDEDGAALGEERPGGGGFAGIGRLSSGVRSKIGKKPAGGSGSGPIRLAAKSPNLSFAPGAELTLQLGPPSTK